MQLPFSIVSIGQGCALIQAMPGRIREAAVALGIEPAARINCVDHYTESDLQKIADFLRSGATPDGMAQRGNIS